MVPTKASGLLLDAIRYTLYVMHLFHSHPRLALFVLAVILVLLGSFIVARKSQVKLAYFSQTAPAENVSEPPFSYDTAVPTEESPLEMNLPSVMQAVVSNPPFSYSSPFVARGGEAAEDVVPTQEISLAEVRGNPETTDSAMFWNLYPLTPRGLISTSIATKTRTPEEKALFDYGNELGSYIGSFEDTHQNTVSSLQDFFSSRGATPMGEPRAGVKPTPAPSPSDGGQFAAEEILRVARDYARLGDTIAKINSVPREIQPLHAALIQGYGEISAGLSAIVATNSGNLAETILAYNASADKFIRNFVAFADFFSARGIKFSKSDTGSIFSFSGVGL